MRKLALIFFCLLLTACNVPLEEDSEDDLNNQAATLVAMTLNAMATPTFTNTPLPTPTLSVTKTPTLTITPTYSVPMLTINEPTNCRTGPGQSYDILFTFNAGASVEILGQYPTNNYWTVKWQGGDGFCWVWGEYTTASGSYWTVPTVNPPPTALPSPPTAPSITNWEYLCGYGGSGPNVTVTIDWTDRSDDESGYRIYRNGESVANLPPNSSAYTEVVDIVEGENITYLVEVYNNAGSARSSPFNFNCQ
jgi:uncharacterized protein YraI